MQITAIEAIPVCVPLKAGLTAKTAHGEHATSPYVIVRMHTDAGITGLGEATVSALWSGETQGTVLTLIREYLAPALIGRDPRDITSVRRTMDFLVKQNPFTKATLEMACWDIAGKAVNAPVWRLLGGRVRDKVRIKLVVWARDIPGSRRMAEQHLAQGVTCIKVKTGLDPETDIARVRAVREVCGPDIPVTIDSNCGWTIQQARHCLRELRDSRLLLAEQPIPAGDFAALAELRKESVVPIMADESVFTLQDAWQLSLHRSADIFSIYPGKPRRDRCHSRHRGDRPSGRTSLHDWQQSGAGHRDGRHAACGSCLPGSGHRFVSCGHHRPVLSRRRLDHAATSAGATGCSGAGRTGTWSGAGRGSAETLPSGLMRIRFHHEC
jgi:muconate cycloisomerase